MKKDITYITIDGRGQIGRVADEVIKASEKLKPGEGIHVIREFEPLPMYKLMEGRGFDKHVEKVSDEEYHIYFFPAEASEESPEPAENRYNITKNTNVGSLLKEYPFLRDYLVALSPKFEKLNSPMFKTMAGVATLNMISARGGLDVSDLIHKIVDEIDKRAK